MAFWGTVIVVMGGLITLGIITNSRKCFRNQL
jgi:hypothetical protein